MTRPGAGAAALFTSIFRGETIAHCTFANNRPGQWLSRDLGGSLCSQAAFHLETAHGSISGHYPQTVEF